MRKVKKRLTLWRITSTATQQEFTTKLRVACIGSHLCMITWLSPNLKFAMFVVVNRNKTTRADTFYYTISKFMLAAHVTRKQTCYVKTALGILILKLCFTMIPYNVAHYHGIQMLIFTGSCPVCCLIYVCVSSHALNV